MPIWDEAAALAAVVASPSLILVSERGRLGRAPETELGRRFRTLGLVNQAVARAADEVVLMVAVRSPWSACGRGRRAAVAVTALDRLVERRAARRPSRRGCAAAARQPHEATREPRTAGGVGGAGRRDHR